MPNTINHSILCADDDPVTRKVLLEILSDQGYRAKVVSNGSQVLSELKRTKFDLILLDYKMPVMDGVEAARRIRSNPNTFNIPIIFISAHYDEDEILRCLQTGGNHFIRKPIERAELLATIKYTIQRYEETFESEGGLPPGARLAGRYEIVQMIDSGGFSNIYKAIDVTDSQRTVYALKVFDSHLTKRNNKQNLYVILREAYQLTKLDHSCIVKIHDFGQVGSVIFFVLEYVDGQPLDIFVRDNGALNEVNSAFIGFEMASALEYLSERNMIHRDVKPDNMMITKKGDVKLVDFGLAKQSHEQTLSIKNDEFKGTAKYVSPECAAGQEADLRSDLYSLGISLYFISTGKTPFEGKDPRKILCQHVQAVPKSPKEHSPRLSDAFCDIVLRTLAKKPEDRPTIDELKSVLGDILSNSHGD